LSSRPASPVSDHRHEHGGRGTDIVLGGNLNAELAALPPETDQATRDGLRAAWQVRHDAALARVVCTSSVPSAMNPGASTISCAAAPAVRAIRVRVASSSRWKTT